MDNIPLHQLCYLYGLAGIMCGYILGFGIATA